MKDELLPLVNESGEIIGKEYRKICHSNPKLLHPVVQCWIFNSKGQILCQQRSFSKDIGAGDWDIICGGHIKLDVSIEQTLNEELEEELGIKDIETIFAGTQLIKCKNLSELAYIYFCILEKGENEFILQKDEVEMVKWCDIKDAFDLFEHSEVEDKKEFLLEQISLIMPALIKKYNINE